jgi:hypothetical protein
MDSIKTQWHYLLGDTMTSNSEQKWMKQFYEGTFLVKGWKEQMQELLQAFSAEQREAVKEQLDHLGEKIGREWAKDNSVRKIDTDHLKQWGKALKSARKKGPDALIAQIRSIDHTVNDLLG